jgi:rhodanese-related sulfurtransferase
MQNKFITAKETKEKKDAELIDVRTPQEFSDEHIKNSTNIPLDLIPNFLEDLSKIKKEIILICRSDNHARIAQKFLDKNKINSKVMLGGILDWKNQKYNLE